MEPDISTDFLKTAARLTKCCMEGHSKNQSYGHLKDRTELRSTINIQLQVHLNKLECRGKVNLFQ